MRKRSFLAALCLCAMTQACFAQNTMPVVGVLSLDNLSRIELLREGLRELGYIDGQNLRLQIGHPGDRYAQLPDIAAEFARSKVNVIVTIGGTATIAASKATRSIPIVMVAGIDPVREKLAASLSRPGGNVTGVSTVLQELTAKRLELAKEAIPGLKDIGILVNSNSISGLGALPEAKNAAARLNIQLNIIEVRSAADFDTAFSALAKTRSKAFLTLPSNMLIANRKEVLDAARKHGLAGFYTSADWAQQGGLFAYAASDADAIKRVANYVSRILKGAKAADLPIEQPTKFELVVNLKTARALDIKIPNSIMLRATKVIE